MSKETIERIDEAITALCTEIQTSQTDKVIALAEALGTILTARANLPKD